MKIWAYMHITWPRLGDLPANDFVRLVPCTFEDGLDAQLSAEFYKDTIYFFNDDLQVRADELGDFG